MNDRARSRQAVAEAGYSLIELLVTTAISVTMVGGLCSVLFESQATYEAQQDLSALRQQARVAMDHMSDELRMAGYDQGSAPERLTIAGASDIALVADIDDGDPGPPCNNANETAAGGGAERIRYRIQGTDLLRSLDCWDGGGWNNEYANVVVARDVQSAAPLFLYFDEDGNQLDPGGGALNAADRDRVRFVEIRLSLTDPDTQALGDPNVDFELLGSVRLRNARF